MNANPLDMLNNELRSRTQPLNARPFNTDARFVLIWLQQTLRGEDHPAIDSGVQIANALALPALVYHGLRDDYPHASARLHSFILSASRAMAQTLRHRGIACAQHVVRADNTVKGLVYRLADQAACVITDAHPTFVANTQAKSFADKSDRLVLAVDATRLVPQCRLASGLTATKAFRAAHEPLRDECLASRIQIEPRLPAYDGPLPFEPDRLHAFSDDQIAALVAKCDIDHSLPASSQHPATDCAVVDRLTQLTSTIITRYKWTRNNPADPAAGSQLSPYLHFGITSPFAVLRALNDADIGKTVRYKFVDELLTWREWCHWRMTKKPELQYYSSLPTSARRTMEKHANDPREVLPLDALIHGDTPDETWNAAQRQWLTTGWMHNNLRMYWAKQLLRWTASPEMAWATACYLNDRLSLDGRDPATYVMMRWAFGEARPGNSELPVYGWISRKSDDPLRKRAGVRDWLTAMANSKVSRVAVPDNEGWAAMYISDSAAA